MNLASISSFIAQPNYVTYNTTKAAILGLTRCMAMDLAGDKIRVNSVCPGVVWTQIVECQAQAMGLDRAAADVHPEWAGAQLIPLCRSQGDRTRDPLSVIRQGIVHHGLAPHGGRRIYRQIITSASEKTRVPFSKKGTRVFYDASYLVAGWRRWKSTTRGRWSEASRARREWTIRAWRIATAPGQMPCRGKPRANTPEKSGTAIAGPSPGQNHARRRARGRAC